MSFSRGASISLSDLRRMSAVHTILTPTVYDGRLIYDKNVEIVEGARVLDAGVGSGEGRYASH